MGLYAILRRDGFADGPTLPAAAARPTEVGETLPGHIRWTRSYAVGKAGGALGTICSYEAKSEEAVRRHAAAANRPSP